MVHSGQGGLLEVAPHPNFATNRLLYLTYSKQVGEPADGRKTRCRRRPRSIRARFENDRLTNVAAAVPVGVAGPRALRRQDRLRQERLPVPVARRSPGAARRQPRGASRAGPHQPSRQDDSPPRRWPGAGGQSVREARRARSPRSGATVIATSRGSPIHPETGDVWANEHGPQGGDELNLIRPMVELRLAGDRLRRELHAPASPSTPARTARAWSSRAQVWVPSIGISGLMIYTGDKFPQWKGNFFVGGMVGRAGRAAHPRCEARLHQPRAAGARTSAASATSGRASTATSISSPTIATASRRRCCGWSRSSGRRRSHEVTRVHDGLRALDQREAAPRAGGPHSVTTTAAMYGCARNAAPAAVPPSSSASAAQRDRQMTGAEDECPYHPHHAPILQLPRDRAARRSSSTPLLRLHRRRSQPPSRPRTHKHDADHRIHGRSPSRNHGVRGFPQRCTATPIAITALVRNPIHGSDPVLKYDSPLITLKMPSSRRRRTDAIASDAGDADRDQQRPPDVGEQRRQERRQAEEHRADEEHAERRARARRRR